MAYVTTMGRLTPVRRSGSERFYSGGSPLDFDLLDFWRWSVSDLVSNATRGRLAEYIVARALGIPTEGVRDEWAAFDLQMLDGTRIEVKSAAFLQSWHQTKPSTILFSVRRARVWNPETNAMAAEPTRLADIYVFALLAHADKLTLNPLDVEQWRFFVVSTAALNARSRSQHSITLRSLDRLHAGPFGFRELPSAVRDAKGRSASPVCSHER